jgi:hypothetical protein
LIGILRAHDLLVVRALTLDENAGDVVEALIPVSDAPPGGFEASRSAEIFRWEQAIGAAVLGAIRAEVAIVTTFLLYQAMLDARVAQTVASTVLEEAALAAFPTILSPIPSLGKYLHTVSPTLAGEVSTYVAHLFGKSTPPEAMDAALTPVLSAIQVDLGVSAALVKSASE